MCIICIEMDKKTLSPWEAKRNLSEMAEQIGQDHALEVDKKISEAIYEEIMFNFGETLHSDGEFCEFCECDPCDCDY